jgi:cell division protein FtsQ
VTDGPSSAAPSVPSTASGAGDGAFGEPAPGSRPQAARPPGAPPRGRSRRRARTRWRAAFFALAGVAIVAGAAWALLGNKLFVVRSVTVTGTHRLAPARVLSAADVKLGTPLLNVDAGVVTRRVEALSQVASATVTEDWPDHLVIAVTERVPVMAVRMATGDYDLVDPTGVILGYSKPKPALPVLVTSLPGGALRGAPEVTTAATVLGELQPWLSKQVAKVTTAVVPAGPRQVTLDLRDGKTVLWGAAGDAAQKNRELAVLLNGQVHYVDVSAPGTVVTK